MNTHVTVPAVDQYDFWRRRLKGEVIPIHDGEPQAGFYRNGPLAVAYWFGKDGNIRCRIDNKPAENQRAMELWPFASKKPVSHEAYTARIETGEWPSENKVVSEDMAYVRANPEKANTFEGVQERLAKLKAAAESLLKAGAASTQDDADAAADLTDRLSKLWTASENLRKVEKQPHWDAAQAVDAKWKPVLTGAEIYKRIKAIVTEPFLKEQKRLKDAAEAEARRVAEQARLAAEEAARKAAETPANDAAGNTLLQQQADEAAAAAATANAQAEQVASQRVTAGTRGRTTHLQTVTTVTITDRAKLLEHFKDQQAITDVLQRLAEAAVKGGFTPPGVTVTNDGSAR